MEMNKRCCPRCGGAYVVKNGKNKAKQRYICRNCGRSFVDTTNTPVYYSKKNMDTWERYVECLVNQSTLEAAAKKVSVSLKTAFYWRHKLMDAIREHFTFSQLSSNVELGRMYIKTCFKGNHGKERPFTKGMNYINCVNRDSFKVCVFTAVDDAGHVAVEPACINIPSPEDLVRIFAGKISEGTRVVTENLLQYKYLCIKCKAVQVVPKAFAREELNEVNLLKRAVVKFLKSYRGVATKYLSNYLHLFKYVENGLKAALLSLRGKEPYCRKNLKGREPVFS